MNYLYSDFHSVIMSFQMLEYKGKIPVNAILSSPLSFSSQWLQMILFRRLNIAWFLSPVR